MVYCGPKLLIFVSASPCDAMDIEDEDSSSSVNKILVGMPNVEAKKQYMQNTYGRQVNTINH